MKKSSPSAVWIPLIQIEGSPKEPVYRWDAYQKIDAVRSGVSKQQLEALKKQTELDYDTLAGMLLVGKATLHSKKGTARFDAAVSERILLVAELYSFGYEVFEHQQHFNDWMKTPNRALGGQLPQALMDTVYGIGEVRNVIGRIAYGVYS